MATETTLPGLGLDYDWDLGNDTWKTGMDSNLFKINFLMKLVAISATTTAEPGSPTNGDVYIIPAGATGTNWAGQDGKIAVWFGAAWTFYTPVSGWGAFVADSGKLLRYSGSTWAEPGVYKSTTNGITASATQTQGQQPLTAQINEIATCATANDVVTLPALLKGAEITVINNGAAILQVFPASGENLGAGVDTSITIPISDAAKFVCYADGSAYQLI